MSRAGQIHPFESQEIAEQFLLVVVVVIVVAATRRSRKTKKDHLITDNVMG